MQLNNQNQLYLQSPDISPKYSSNNILYNNMLESPKSILNPLNTYNSSKQLLTNNSKSLNLKKFSSINTNTSKNSSMNSSLSKHTVTSYISCSTLQSGVASYSIPKTTRFKNSYKNAYCDNIYSLPEYTSTGVSIGNGPRRELWDKEKANIPSSHDYVSTSTFEENLIKNKGYTIAKKHEIKDGMKNFPGPADYDKKVEWTRQSPCTFKFRKNYFYDEDSKKLHNVSPMKYLPERKCIESNRYKTYGIGIGLGRRSQDQYNPMKGIPGPGDYFLPSIFDKRIQGKYPIN